MRQRIPIRIVLSAVLALLALAAAAGIGPAGAAAGPTGNPFAHGRLFVDPHSDAAQEAASWAGTRPAAAAEMRKIASEPWAEWYGDWLADPGRLFRYRVQ